MSTAVAENELLVTGKKIVLVRNLKEKDADGNLAVEVEGTVQAWNEGMGLLLKPKGKVNFELIPADEIEPDSIAEVSDSNTKLKASKLQLVKEGAARRHLLERHNYTLKAINSMTEDEALKAHSEIDHVASDLGHVHVEKKADDKAGESDSADES